MGLWFESYVLWMETVVFGLFVPAACKLFVCTGPAFIHNWIEIAQLHRPHVHQAWPVHASQHSTSPLMKLGHSDLYFRNFTWCWIFWPIRVSRLPLAPGPPNLTWKCTWTIWVTRNDVTVTFIFYRSKVYCGIGHFPTKPQQCMHLNTLTTSVKLGHIYSWNFTWTFAHLR